MPTPYLYGKKCEEVDGLKFFLKRIRDKLIEPMRELQDEGDRVYFGSSNHADEMRWIVIELNDWYHQNFEVDDNGIVVPTPEQPQ